MVLPEFYEIQKQFIKDCISIIENGKIGIFSSPTGTGKTLSILLSLKNFITENEEEDNFLEDIFGVNTKKAKIYYCSRTHSQLRQVVNEFKKLEIKTGGAVLGSRKVYCVNKDINKQASMEVINSKCRELISENKCKFYREHYKEVGIFSIEDLIIDSKEHTYCPYYFTKEYFKRTEIVFLPYNMLFSEDSRQSFGINLDSAIVIVDEAHNIIDIVSQINTAYIKLEDLQKYISAANKYKKILKGGSKNSRIVNFLIEFLQKFVLFIERQSKERVLEVSDFLLETKLHNFNTLELSEEIKTSNLILKLEHYEKKLDLKLQEITKFINLLVASDNSSRIECGKGFLKIFPLNPKIFFEPFKCAKSIIFAGGTMEPVDELRDIFSQRGVESYAYQSSERKFRAFIVDKLYERDVEIKQTTREDHDLFKKLNKMILEVFNDSIEGGVVVFLPSKYYLEYFKTVFKAIEKTNCFFEGENKFEEYVLSVRRTKSILFAVIGGTYSEGVNFSDDLCRNLIIVGVPYPNVDTEINEKIKLFGFEWYTQTAMKKVNQTIGRAIRHNEDYANIILVDKRYVKLKKYLSSWISSNLIIEKFDKIKVKAKDFLLECLRE